MGNTRTQLDREKGYAIESRVLITDIIQHKTTTA